MSGEIWYLFAYARLGENFFKNRIVTFKYKNKVFMEIVVKKYY